MSVLRNLLFIGSVYFFCLNSAHSGAAEGISIFREKLLAMSPIEVTIETLKVIPDLSLFDKVKAELYVGVKEAGSGQDALVYVAKSKIDRPEISLKAGDPIAIRAARMKTTQEKSSVAVSLANFVRLNGLKGITDFFPVFYGTYTAIGPTKYMGNQDLNHQEMEPVDETFANEFNCGKDYKWQKAQKKISNRMVLEFCLGEWAGKHFAQVGSQDDKPDNWAVKKVANSRIYKVANQQFTFLINTAHMPKRIDVGGAGIFSKDENIKGDFYCSLRRYSPSNGGSQKCDMSDEAEKFLSDLGKKRENSIFEVFNAFYEKSCKNEKADDDIDNSAPAKTFVWPEIK